MKVSTGAASKIGAAVYANQYVLSSAFKAKFAYKTENDSVGLGRS